MKIFFISDIHGSLFYAGKAMEAYEKENADYIVILGDELYHGARNPLPLGYEPKETALLLNKYADKIIAVRGNCDSEVDEMVLNFPTMSTYSTILVDEKRLFLTHGHIFNEDNLPKLSDGDVFIYGHTHVPKAERKENIFIINPGSVSMPKEDNPNTYGMLESTNNQQVFSIKDFDGNVLKVLNMS